MGRFTELRHELVQSQRHLAVARMRFARQAVLACARDQFGQIILVRAGISDGREQQPSGDADR